MMQAEDVELARLRRTRLGNPRHKTSPLPCSRPLVGSMPGGGRAALARVRVCACARVRVRVPLTAAGGAGCNPPARWDGRRLELFDGTYGDYLISKVAKVSPSQLPRSS